ncbi:MAG: hypothetical protein AB7F99_03990 [Vicinamibacterales bacterium]
MSDRKYRQRGYQDEPRREPARPKQAPQQRAPGRQLQDAAGPKTPNLMASHEVFRCARCGNLLAVQVTLDSRCNRCGSGVHSCINCVSFDTSARWECTQTTLPARVAPKDERNLCTLFAPRTTVERQTGTASAPEGPSSARRAFDDLFK